MMVRSEAATSVRHGTIEEASDDAYRTRFSHDLRVDHEG